MNSNLKNRGISTFSAQKITPKNSMKYVEFCTISWLFNNKQTIKQVILIDFLSATFWAQLC